MVTTRSSFHKGFLTHFGGHERENKGITIPGTRQKSTSCHPLLTAANLMVVDAVILMQTRKGLFIDVGNGVKSRLIGTSCPSPPTNGTDSLSHRTKKPILHEEVTVKNGVLVFCHMVSDFDWHGRSRVLTQILAHP